MVRVGLIGIGGMGRVHFNCYAANTNATLVALCDIDRAKRTGNWSSVGLNIDPMKSDAVNLSGIRVYEKWNDLIQDRDVDIVDICLPTALHAEVTVAALLAGKDVLCEKPMALTPEQCSAVELA